MVIVVFGLPGTGKTHFSERLQKEIGARHLNTDKIRAQLHKKGEYSSQTKQFIYEELIKEARSDINKGLDVIIDGTFHKKHRREMIQRLSEDTRQTLIFIEIAAKETSVKSRLALKRKYSEANFEVYQKIKTEMDPCKLPHLTLWSDSGSIEMMISKAKTYIYEHQSDK
jgi:predicted kinase